MTRAFDYEELATADLVVDAIYRGASQKGQTQTHYRDPFSPLLGVKAQGGFRWRGATETSAFMVIYSDFVQTEWPDRIDESTGRVTYYGDNRKPGSDLHDTPGNRWLRDALDAVQSGRRSEVPPIFVFTKAGTGRDVRYRGLAVVEDLVAVWRSSKGSRFQNYQARLVILDAPTVSRVWIGSLEHDGPAALDHAPRAWREWVETGLPVPLVAPSVTRVRSRDEQLPSAVPQTQCLSLIHEYFSADPYQFESFASWICQRMDENVTGVDLTRPWRDGGRDGLGRYRIGPLRGAIEVDFALEAKCYDPQKNGVGVREVSRLISRLRHRQFGVLVTTSHVNRQAYEEIIEDEHPVVVITGGDLVDLLPGNLLDARALRSWLASEFPLS